MSPRTRIRILTKIPKLYVNFLLGVFLEAFEKCLELADILGIFAVIELRGDLMQLE